MNKDKDNPIVLVKENLAKYGFACFYTGPYPELIDGYRIRNIEMAVDGSTSSIQQFKIPEEFLISLPENIKIAEDKHFAIGLNPSAADLLKLLSKRAGWNQTEDDKEFLSSQDVGDLYIATYDINNRVIALGSGLVLPVNEDLSWIGMILVHPELRRQGIARSMMLACLDDARNVQKKSIIGLDATPMGKQVYDSLGFKDSFLIWRSILSTDLDRGNYYEYQIIPLDLGRVSEFLKKKNYEERIQIIRLLNKIPRSVNFMAESKNGIHGIIMSRPGRLKPFIGPLIADSPEVAQTLLLKALHYWKSGGFAEVFMDIPEQHTGKNSIFENSDFLKDSQNQKIPVKPVRSLMRMYQLISKEEIDAYSDHMDRTILKKAVEGYEKTFTFMEKERNVIAPIMYGTSGPEWS